jgi:type II secretory pathway pseudopilin PulG
MPTSLKQEHLGMTRIEVLALIAVLGTLGLVLVVVVVQRSREAHARQQTMNHLKQVLLALSNCHDAYKRLPPAWGPFPPPPPGVKQTGPSATCHFWLPPFWDDD